MEIGVVVPTEVHWQAFLRDLRDVWEYGKGPGYVQLGNIRYRMINLSYDQHRYYGLRVDKLYLYNCWPDPGLILRLQRWSKLEIIEIWN